MFTLTHQAALQIRESAGRSGTADAALRVAARRESDGSIVYGMGFDEPREGDMPLEVEGIQLLIAPPSQALLQATRLDFVELEPGSFSFIFIAGDALAKEPPRSGCGSGGCSNCGG
jgi:iron-sulfur cluster assembly protein